MAPGGVEPPRTDSKLVAASRQAETHRENSLLTRSFRWEREPRSLGPSRWVWWPRRGPSAHVSRQTSPSTMRVSSSTHRFESFGPNSDRPRDTETVRRDLHHPVVEEYPEELRYIDTDAVRAAGLDEVVHRRRVDIERAVGAFSGLRRALRARPPGALGLSRPPHVGAVAWVTDRLPNPRRYR